MPAPLYSLKARLRSSGGRAVRRLGLLPGGEPDGLGDDDQLGDLVVEQRIAAFFPEPLRNVYQLEQWLEPLRALDEYHGVVIVTQDSRTTARLRSRTSLPVLCVARTSTLEDLVRRSALGLALYVSHHPRNFQFLRFPGLAHVYAGHGESDKAVSASNQLKAYDRVFVAGQAAADRILRELLWYDADRMLHVGRPQLASAARDRSSGRARPTVLYAPTWEGAQATMAYSSVLSHGVGLVRSLLDAGLRVVYRPHPRTGANRHDVAAADRAVRALFAGPDAVGSDSAVVTDAPLAEAFADADLLITDVSSLAVEWLPTTRPLVVTVPEDPGAAVPESPLLDAVPRLSAREADTAGALVEDRLRNDREHDVRAGLVEYYLGDDAPGAASARFLAAVDTVLASRDAAVAARSVANR